MVADGQRHASCQLQYTYKHLFSRRCVSLKGMRGHLSRLDIYISSIFIRSKSITPTRVFTYIGCMLISLMLIYFYLNRTSYLRNRVLAVSYSICCYLSGCTTDFVTLDIFYAIFRELLRIVSALTV